MSIYSVGRQCHDKMEVTNESNSFTGTLMSRLSCKRRLDDANATTRYLAAEKHGHVFGSWSCPNSEATESPDQACRIAFGSLNKLGRGGRCLEEAFTATVVLVIIDGT